MLEIFLGWGKVVSGREAAPTQTPPVSAPISSTHTSFFQTIIYYNCSTITARLLAAGHTVHGQVPNLSEAGDIANMPHAANRLVLFEANLSVPNALDACLAVRDR